MYFVLRIKTAYHKYFLLQYHSAYIYYPHRLLAVSAVDKNALIKTCMSVQHLSPRKVSELHIR
jgi:hypothetical protein